MRLTVVGCSGSFAGPGSPASSYLVTTEHEGRTWRVLLDLGSGALGALQRHIDPVELDAVLLTHLHPDHCIDLLGLYVTRQYRPTGRPRHRLPVHAPAGARQRIDAAYESIEEPGTDAVFDYHEITDREPVRVGPFVITPYLVHHPVEAYGFRVEAQGRVLAYTGDTDSCEALAPLLTGAHLALTDSAFVEGRDTIRGIHLTGRRAAEAAVAAGGVQRLMLTHIPAWNAPGECHAEADQVWPGEVELAQPDAVYEV